MAKSHEKRFRNRQEVKAHRRNQQEAGFTFKLSATGLGLPEDEQDEVRVKRLSLRDAAAFSMIPDDMQAVVNRGLQLIEDTQKKSREEGRSTETLRDRLKGNEDMLRAADAFCIVTFIEPKLYATEADLEDAGDSDGWVVTDIHPDDRIDILFANLDADSSAAKKFRTYTPRSVIDVGPGSARPVAPEPSDDTRVSVGTL